MINELCSNFRLLAKAGVKVSPGELAARASPTAPRRSDLPKLDSSLLHTQQQFPLPASVPPASVAAMMHNANNGGNLGEGMNPMQRTPGGDPEDLRVPTTSPFLNRGAMGGPGGAHHPMAGHPGMGSALLDTYLTMIAAAGGDSSTMAAALGSFPGRAAAFAQAAQAAQQMGGPLGAAVNLAGKLDLKANGKDDERSVSEDREDEAMASDADISDTEEGLEPVPMAMPSMTKPPADEDSIAAEDN